MSADRYANVPTEVLLDVHEYAEFMLKSMRRGGPPLLDAIARSYVTKSVLASAELRRRGVQVHER